MKFDPIASGNSIVYFENEGYTALNSYLKEEKPSKIFVLVDSNTLQDCLPIFLAKLETEIVIETIEIEPGESFKTIDTCVGVWNALSELNADRKSIILNLGGGVVTDLGGFVALTFKRGIPYINIPTSLLAMVDASVGGKTGVDLGVLKNQIGVISHSEMVIVDTNYLKTLPGKQIRSGHAEILKHGLITSKSYWDKCSDIKNLTLESYDAIIYESVQIKNNVVTKDPKEKGLRKTLNFGHTLGHAIESYLLEHDTKDALLHGEAVAAGMILALHLSEAEYEFPSQEKEEICNTLLSIYGKISLNHEDYQHIIELLKFDKKNTHGKINFILLKGFGEAVLDCQISNERLLEAFNYYKNL
ncbi:3-dehydroquinate synthase [Croceibacter atlanticus]|uniref:3-dehydroquinate synthase n=1 Tax=Croceibacter atlanticus TaxID=313588 RepID=UPI001C5E9BA8|nr:3-dehydroquinate synthase [Croceibacter atlanticus]MBW4971054.1 3-dehydroquinate synthase [Croceibacter atlanticus]